MGKLKIIYNRIYNDFLMPSRLNEYEKIIQDALKCGYQHITIKDYYKKLINNQFDNKKYFLHRHDIDTDIRTAKKFFEIEKKYNIKTTYYFRLSTIDIEFMKEINSYGSEVGYHFEEIAQYCKDNHIKSLNQVMKDMPIIKNKFINNFLNLEKKLGFKIESVASHGDFVNRKLNITNNEITKDIEVRKKLGLLLESYDKNLQDTFNIYISDTQYPIFYKPINIFAAIGKYNTICMLTHPRQWETNILVNLFDNFKRVLEGIKW
jgi:hypothetical protein